MNDSIYAGSGMRDSSPLTREIGKAQSGYRESAGENKQVNFSLNVDNPATENSNLRLPQSTLQPIPVKRAQGGNSSRVPRNFRLLAKQSFEK